MIRILIIISMFGASIDTNAQMLFGLESSFGLGLNNNLHLSGQEVKNDLTYSINSGATFTLPFFTNYSVETGLYIKYLYSTGSINQIQYRIQSLKAYTSFYVSRKFCEQYLLGIGLVFANNKDRVSIDFDKPYNFRCDFSTKLQYLLNNKWCINFIYNRNITKIPSMYLISYPKNEFLIGATYVLNKKSS